MTARHHSLPPASLRRPSSSHSLTSSTTAAAAPTTLLARHATAHGAGTNASRLVAQADALARMTLELNLRAVSSQANRMEKQLRKLVLATADDAEFRRQNEARMSAMWREIVAVRQRAGEQKDIAFLDAETCRRETEKVVRGIRDEVGELKELVAGISTLVDGLPSAEEVKRLVGEEKKTVVEQQVCSPAKTQPLKSQPPRTPAPKTPPPTTPTSRIREAINSTRRWNRDHKTTALSDAVFCANYLRQQSKRDPAVAVFIQKAVQRRVRAKEAATPSQKPKAAKPKSLDEFCQRVTWADVRAAVEDTLVRDTTDVMRLLR